MAKKNRNKQINSLIAPLSPKRASKVIAANSRLKFGDESRGLQGDLRAGRQDARNTNAWFREYQDQMKSLTSSQGTANAGLQDQMRENANYFGRQNFNTDSATRAEEDRSAAIRGAVADPTGATRDQAAEDQRQALMASSRDRAAQIGESANSLLRGVSSASELGRQADQRQIRNTQVETRNKIRNLNRDKGAFKLSEWDRLRTGERDWNIQNRSLDSKNQYSNAIVTQAQLGLAGKQASANATLGAAQLYSGAKIKAAKIYNAGNGQKVKGADLLRAQDYLRAEMTNRGNNWKQVARNKNTWFALLTSRGADPIAARVAVRRLIKLNTAGPEIGSAGWAKKKKERSGR